MSVAVTVMCSWLIYCWSSVNVDISSALVMVVLKHLARIWQWGISQLGVEPACLCHCDPDPSGWLTSTNVEWQSLLVFPGQNRNTCACKNVAGWQIMVEYCILQDCIYPWWYHWASEYIIRKAKDQGCFKSHPISHERNLFLTCNVQFTWGDHFAI